MKRYKRLYVVLAVLLAACIATFALSRYKAQKEQIQTSGETILSISADEVESLSWDYDGQTLSFHRDGAWSYDDDAAFPVDAEQMNLLLEPFAAFGAAFIIEDVDDLGQYGWITRCAPSASPPAGRLIQSNWGTTARWTPSGMSPLGTETCTWRPTTPWTSLT